MNEAYLSWKLRMGISHMMPLHESFHKLSTDRLLELAESAESQMVAEKLNPTDDFSLANFSFIAGVLHGVLHQRGVTVDSVLRTTSQ